MTRHAFNHTVHLILIKIQAVVERYIFIQGLTQNLVSTRTNSGKLLYSSSCGSANLMAFELSSSLQISVYLWNIIVKLTIIIIYDLRLKWLTKVLSFFRQVLHRRQKLYHHWRLHDDMLELFANHLICSILCCCNMLLYCGYCRWRLRWKVLPG